MTKLILPLVLLFLMAFSASAQMRNGLYGNEWINYSQSYYKIKVWTDGIHRIPRQTLQTAGMNTASIQSADYQLILRGEQVPIYVHAPNGTLEYIEFYGERNRGQIEGDMYNREAWHFNPEYSLINDTAAYFLSWSAGANNTRFNNRSTDLSTLPTAESSCIYTANASFGTAYQYGKSYAISGALLYKSTFEYGEGYGTNAANITNFTVPVANTASGTARVQMRVYGVGAILHTPEITVTGSVRYTGSLVGDSVATLDFTLPSNQLQSPNTSISLRGAVGTNDVYNVSSLKITYPRTFNFGGAANFRFALATNGQRKYMELSNIDATNATTQQMYVYDLANRTRTQGFWDGTRLRCDLPAGTLPHDLYFANLANANTITTVGRADAVTFNNYTIPQGDYIIVSHPRLYAGAGGVNPVFSYAAYRASTGYSPVIMDINEIYNQFSYGVEYHPMAVRNMAHFLKNNWAGAKYIFIIGKGRVSHDIRQGISNDFLIPTWGYPPSDNLLIASTTSDVPALPIGRLAATTPAQVSTYLQKIEDVEGERNLPQTALDRGWMKNILHLGGGRNSLEQNLIRFNLDAMRDIAVQPRYGAHVESFFKTSTSPIQAAQSAYLDSLINGGVSMITFFGHSSANSFDFNLDYPSAYNNYRRYPLIMALGCYGGSIFENGPRISEDFIFEPQAGAAVFLASVGAGALGALNDFANRFYRHQGGQYYGEGGGLLVQKTIETLETTGFYSTTVQMAAHFMCYHGDPAFNLNTSKRPDYYIDNQLVSHSPQTVTTQINTFDLNLDIRNLGEAIDTVFWIEVEREMPDGSIAIAARQRVQAPFAQSLITIPINVGGITALGINRFTIRIDADEEIDEQPAPAAEQNNVAVHYIIRIVSDAILPVYPAEFAIVPTQPITLKASTGNVLAAAQTYAIQIDTTAYFNSPVFQETRIIQAGGLIEWTPTMTYQDSTVYYWRVSPDSLTPQAGYQWAGSSFIHIQGAFPGWNQSHYFQYLRDNLRNITLVEGVRKFNFVNSLQELLIRNGFTPTPLFNDNLATYINGSRVDKCNCPYEKGVFVQVIDPETGIQWSMPGAGNFYGATNCDLGGRPSTLYLFKTNQPNIGISQANQNSLLNFIRDTVPDGHFVAFFTLNDAGATNWIADLGTHLISEGAQPQYINTLTSQAGGAPYVFFYKKGEPSYAYKKDTLGANNNSIVDLPCLMEGSWISGDLSSTVIGPVNSWTHLYWAHSDWNLPATNTDTVSVDIYGLDATQTPQLLANNVQQLDTSLAWIDANQYPYLRLVWNTKDAINSSSAHLDYWRILADLAPEAALRPELLFTLDSDTIERGRPLNVAIAMENISLVDMDSMLVKFQVLGTNIIEYQRLAPLGIGDTLIASTSITTLDLSGGYQLLVEINPNSDQREMYHFNNVALISFFVNRDVINPLLDVTFDGVHIFNGDIVSSEPEIVIQLSDENKYLALNEPSDFTVIAKNSSLPNGEIQLDATNSQMTFFPASPGNLSRENKARLVLKPTFPTDGTYTLFVSAKDRSNNNSGNLSYSVDFEIVNTPAISNVLNYPNPFTTSTQFVFTLTGRTLPDELKIQIFTVSGKLVREIGMDELGALRIGLNRTDFAWDGTDMYGDRLANGVYLYRVVAHKDGSEMEAHRNGRIDYMFKQGFGKMYLMR
jgi:hypothetical protein